ncbi:homoserine O-acetyltransferase/O-succinyltransferase [Geosmithia morbida]|uniref:Homoserine O-acetyltransferase/O-succinyltransferase n=1 Tax=Geosmithia morbida TaxID=1094350 RepID=A0A9P5D7D2_9HYPO|nr:homoserine O-acetyltransferase/O-succinyltransferase [Geosmithia morbida]KAF4125675.1 homoserine O-acetyltransferase/O-succinyltransferase [Geosmithia morbida]
MSDIKTFGLGNFTLQSGATIPSAWISYRTFGDASSPAVVYPTWFSGSISDNEWLVGGGKTLDPSRYFIVIPALIGNGQSVSPSNWASTADPPSPFPDVTLYDNVRAQHLLVTQGLGIRHIRAVLGWSMGAAQSFQWATQFPDMMDICVPFCGAAKTSLHNQVFLEGAKAALLAARGLSSAGIPSSGGAGPTDEAAARTWSSEERTVGLKAFGRVYAGWGFSQTFYRQELHRKFYGASDMEDFLVNFWEAWALGKHPDNLLVMLHTWQAGDVSAQEPYNGDFAAAMAAIRAKTLVLPSKTDLYFPPEDSEHEVQSMSPGIGQLDIYPSVWGHWAGGPPGNMEDVAWLDKQLANIFASAPKRA